MLMNKTKRAVVFSTLSMLIPLGCSSLAQAQMCGQYGISLVVTNEAGEALRNVKIRFVPEFKLRQVTVEFKQDPEDAKLFRLMIPEGDSVAAHHELRISAPGFKKYSQKVELRYCERKRIRVELVEKQSAAHRSKGSQ